MSKKTVAILDYGMGNLFSIQNICEQIGLEVKVTADKATIQDAAGLILPGVGAFGKAILRLEELDLLNEIVAFTKSGKAFLGLCLGLQLLFERSEEFGEHAGLGVVKGDVVRFPNKTTEGDIIKVPHIGWNNISLPEHLNDWAKTSLAGIDSNEYFYFVHSYIIRPSSKEIILANCTYRGVEFPCGIEQENITAYQFHPENSAAQGLRVFSNFAAKL